MAMHDGAVLIEFGTQLSEQLAITRDKRRMIHA